MNKEEKGNYTPKVTKVPSALHVPQQQDGLEIDLSNRRDDDSAMYGLSKTATDEFLAASQQQNMSNTQVRAMAVQHMLDSNMSSPSMRSEMGIKGTAQFKAPLEQIMHHQRVPPHQQEVLAASVPGHSHHLKSQSTGNSNYLSNLQTHADQIQELAMASHGRVTETWDKKKGQAFVDSMQSIHPLANQGQAKSAVLTTNTSKQYGGSGGGTREIKKIPSKKNVVSEKKKRTHQKESGNAQQHPIHTQEAAAAALQMANEGDGKRGSGNYRNTSQTNRNGNLSEQQQNQMHPIVPTHTPLLGQMFQPPPMPHGDQYQGFQFVSPLQQNQFSFATQGLPPGYTTQHQQQILATSHLGFQMQPQPQVHFIAKQQKFYGISPERAPLIFKQSSQDKRPYTSSGHILNKRIPKQNQQNNAIAALYLGSKTHNNGFGISQPRNQSQPIVEQDNYQRISQMTAQNPTQAAYSMQGIPSKVGFSNKKQNQGHSNSAHVQRKDKNQAQGPVHPIYGQVGPIHKMPEALHQEVLQLKQVANTHNQENLKLRTKIKILENEMGRKERTLEDLLQQNQFIQNAQKNGGNGTLAPIVQTAQRYQAETFLVMSLKKQVKEQKAEILKKEEEVALVRKNIKNTKFYEMDQELKLYRDELIRLRYLLEQAYSKNEHFSDGQQTTARPSAFGFTANTTLGQNPFCVINQNQSQPSILPTPVGPNTGSFKQSSNSQTNFFPDTASDYSKQPAAAVSACQKQPSHQYTLSNDDQVSNNTSEPTPTSLPPLKAQLSNGHTTPINMPMQHAQNQDLLLQQSMYTQQAMSISVIDTKENEIIQKLSLQLAEKETLIRKQQSQIDEIIKKTPARNLTSEGKGGSAGPSVKSELQRVKKMLREKEKEIQKLKSENMTHASQKVFSDEEQEKKVKQMTSQISQFQKRQQEMKQEMKKLEEQNKSLSLELTSVSDAQKKQLEMRQDEISRAKTELEAKVDHMTMKMEEQASENKKLMSELELTRNRIEEMERKGSSQTARTTSESAIAKEATSAQEMKPAENQGTAEALKKAVKINPKVEGELGLISTVLGCRENRDRIEFAFDLKKYVEKTETVKSSQKKDGKPSYAGLASDYALKLTPELQQFVKENTVADLATSMPRYDFISPSLALLLMGEVRRMLIDPEIVDILNEKENETKLPFDALRDLCARFDRNFTDEHCAFITASYLTEIDEAIIYINFKEFLSDLKDPRSRDLEIATARYRATSSIGSEGSADSDFKKKMRGGRESSPLGDIISRSAGRAAMGLKKKSLDEEHMLDVAEAIFIKMAELLTEKGRTVRGVFTKYSIPEIFPDRSILELLSPKGFLQGIKETGIDDLQEFEIACLMRVLGKPELDNAVILNEFIMIMENFGVLDQGEDEDLDDYIPDTEPSAHENDSQTGELSEQAKDATLKTESENQTSKKKSALRQCDFKKIDAKGIKILRKLARFLLKQFLHPREFFGKAITKQTIKTKKREFYLDTLQFKDFYLRIKIANIRKRLVENESLNNAICLDKKAHKELINVKVMVRALEEIAEEEQKILIQEEKDAFEKMKKDQESGADGKKDSVEVETPRSECSDGDKSKQSAPDGDKKPSKSKDAAKKVTKEEKKDARESYCSENMIKFGNSGIRSKTFSNHSPLLGDRFHMLNTIEEEKLETQTSNYVENASEREDSKLLGSQHLRASTNERGIDFEEDLRHKMSPDLLLNKSLCRDDKNNKSSMLVSPTENDHIRIELRKDRESNVGRLTGRQGSWKENPVSKSLKETFSAPFSEREADDVIENPQSITPQNNFSQVFDNKKTAKTDVPAMSPDSETKRQL